MAPWDYFEDLSNLKDEIADCGFFEASTIVRHRWIQKYSAESYAGLFRTYSDFLSLPKRTQGRIAEPISLDDSRSQLRNDQPRDGVCIRQHFRRHGDNRGMSRGQAEGPRLRSDPR